MKVRFLGSHWIKLNEPHSLTFGPCMKSGQASGARGKPLQPLKRFLELLRNNGSQISYQRYPQVAFEVECDHMVLIELEV